MTSYLNSMFKISGVPLKNVNTTGNWMLFKYLILYCHFMVYTLNLCKSPLECRVRVILNISQSAWPTWLQLIDSVFIIMTMFTFDVGGEKSFQWGEEGFNSTSPASRCFNAEPLTHLEEFHGFHWESWWALVSQYGLTAVISWQKIKKQIRILVFFSYFFLQKKSYLLYWHKLYQQLQPKKY